MRAPTCSKTLQDLNLPPTPKEGVHTLSCPDVGQEGKREVWVLNVVIIRTSKMESEPSLQILLMFCFYGDRPNNKQILWRQSCSNKANHSDGRRESYVSAVDQ